MTLDAYARALSEFPNVRDSRLRIEHAQVLAPQDIPRFAKLRGYSLNATRPIAPRTWVGLKSAWDPSASEDAYAWRSLLKNRSAPPPQLGLSRRSGESLLWNLCRDNAAGSGWQSGQRLASRNKRLTLIEALRGYTIEAAYAEFEEKAKGSIEIGKPCGLHSSSPGHHPGETKRDPIDQGQQDFCWRKTCLR